MNDPQSPKPPAFQRAPVLPDRVRAIAGQGFAFVPHRFLREGFFASLGPDELRLYFLLVLAADRYGVSFYHYDTLCSLLQLPVEAYIEARNTLIGKDLIASDGTRLQVLSLPEQPVGDPAPVLRTPQDFETHDRPAVAAMLRRSLRDRR